MSSEGQVYFWSRSGSYFDLLLWFVLCGLWIVGGWLLTTHAFRLRPRERLFAGIASGLLLFIVFVDLLGHTAPLDFAYWCGAAVVLIIGALAAWRSDLRPRLPITDLLNWQPLLAFTAVLVLFTLINRGLAIFDDYFNLPLISTIAASDLPPGIAPFPPRYHLNPGQPVNYHYGLHLHAAALVRIGGFFPWSAFDLTKALSTALSLILSWYWFRRYVRNRLVCFLGVLLVLFAGGTRWLLLFLPTSTLEHIGSGLQLLGTAIQTGADLRTALVSPWLIEGGGPFPFPFAFSNGIFMPLSMAMGSRAAFPMMTLLLLLIVGDHKQHPPVLWRAFPGILFGLLLASLILLGEHLFLILWGGILVAAVISSVLRRRILWSVAWSLVPAALLVPLLGGALSPLAHGFVERFSTLLTQADSLSNTASDFGAKYGVSMGIPPFSLRWPPAVISSHLGPLSLDNPEQILIALFEIGPMLLLAPFVIWQLGRRLRLGKWLLAGVSIAALVGLFGAVTVHFAERERDLSRLLEASLWIWLLLGFPIIWHVKSKAVRVFAGITCIASVVSGVVLFSSQIISIAQPQLSYFISQTDARISQAYWNKLPHDAWVIDLAYPFRPATLFARGTGPAYENIYIQFVEYQELIADPDPVRFAQAGYDYFYTDRKTWLNLAPEQRQRFENDCVKLLANEKDAIGDFRRLYDLQGCN